MRAVFYKDIKQSAVWIAMICITFIIMVCVLPMYSFRFLFSYCTWMLFIIPSTIAMSDTQEKVDKMYSIMPIKPNAHILLRFLYISGVEAVTTVIFQTIVCLSNYWNGYSFFNINNMIAQSILTITMVFAALWLLSSLIVKNRFINTIIIMLSAVTFGIFISFFRIEVDFSRIDYIEATERLYFDHRFDILLRVDFHVIFWCVCVLIVYLCYAVACNVSKKRDV